MLIATYDYWGYYNVCFLGDEIKDPEKNIPRALLLSILLVACLYLMMNVCILGRGAVAGDAAGGAGQQQVCMLCHCSCRGCMARGRRDW